MEAREGKGLGKHAMVSVKISLSRLGVWIVDIATDRYICEVIHTHTHTHTSCTINHKHVKCMYGNSYIEKYS